MVIKHISLIIIGLFLLNFAIAGEVIAGNQLADDINLIENDAVVESYLEKITIDTDAVVIILLKENAGAGYSTWSKETGQRYSLGNIGDPKKNILIGYFRDENVLAVMSKDGSSVKKSLKDEVQNMLKGAIDSKDDAKFLEAIKVLGEGLGVKEEKKAKVLTLEECKATLEQRKKELEIPDKLCYWEAMTDLYDEKCDNLNREEISEIFEKKAEYRQLNNQDWPSLNTDGDFCIPVIYDCDEWIKEKKIISDTINGYVDPEKEEIVIMINPFVSFPAEKVSSLLLHEGLHTIQNHTIDNRPHLFEEGSFIMQHEFYQKFPELKAILEKDSILLENISDVLAKIYSEEIEKEDYWGRDSEVNKRHKNECDDFYIALYDKGWAEYQDIISKDNYFYNHFSEDDELISAIKRYRDYHFGEQESAGRLYMAYSYTSRLEELDPRLSEVSRWWFDQTNPNCQIIYTSEMFGVVFEKFLGDTNTAEEYQLTKEQFNDVLKIAEMLGEREEVWDKLINRGSGLASNTQIDDNTAYA